MYISTDASDPLAATLENVPLTPATAATPEAALVNLVAFTNGATGAANPQRQGLASAIKDGLSPLNVAANFPGQVRHAAGLRGWGASWVWGLLAAAMHWLVRTHLTGALPNSRRPTAALVQPHVGS